MKLSLGYPLKNPITTQGFGAKSPVYTSQGMLGHNGLDLLANHGDPLHASHDGFASFQIDSGGGCGVVIITDKEYDYQGSTTLFKTIYWHMCNSHIEPQFKSPFEDKTGFTKVLQGDVIGYADNTGQSSGDHCHWALKPCAKGEAWGTYYNIEPNNGYMGCIDPTPYLESNNPDIIEKQKLVIRLATQVIGLLNKLILWKKQNPN